MKIIVREVSDDQLSVKILDITEISQLEAIKLDSRSIISIDGSTTNSGLTIIDETTGKIRYIMAFARDKDNESKVAYKVRFKKAMGLILKNNVSIRKVYYEEPFIEYAGAAESLLMLRTSVEELIVEEEPNLNYIDYVEIANTKWKSLWFYPDKIAGNKEEDKKTIKRKLIEKYPCLSGVTQDEADATSMGLVAVNKIISGQADELKSNKKVTKFKYDIKFMLSEDIDILIQEIIQDKDVPRTPLMNGIKLITAKSKNSLEKLILQEMGDEDRLLIIKFNPRYFGDIVLQYRIGYLAEESSEIYAIVWRKNRKK